MKCLKGLEVLAYDCLLESHCHNDKLDDYITIYIQVIQFLRAPLFFNLGNRRIYWAINLMHGVETGPNVIWWTDL